MTPHQLTALAACAMATIAVHEGYETLANQMQDWFDEVGIPQYLSYSGTPGYFKYDQEQLAKIEERWYGAALPPLPEYNK